MSADLVALLLIFFAHCVAAVVLIGPLALSGRTTATDVEPDDPPDGPDDGGLRRRQVTPRPRPGGGLPLPDAVPAMRRFRGPGRLGDDQRPARRRTAPDRQPVRTLH